MPGPESLAILAVFSIPIVAILTAHQRKMAQLIHGTQGPREEVEALRREVTELRNLVYQQAIKLDSLSGSQVQSLTIGQD